MNGNQSTDQKVLETANLQMQQTDIPQQDNESSDEFNKMLAQGHRILKAHDNNQRDKTTAEESQKPADANRSNLDRQTSTSLEPLGKENTTDIEVGNTSRRENISSTDTHNDSTYSKFLKRAEDLSWSAARGIGNFTLNNKVAPYELGAIFASASFVMLPVSDTTSTALGSMAFSSSMLYSVQKNRETIRDQRVLIDEINHLARDLKIKELSLNKDITELLITGGSNGAGILLQIIFTVFSAIVFEAYKDKEEETTPTTLKWFAAILGAISVFMTAQLHVYVAHKLSKKLESLNELMDLLTEFQSMANEMKKIPESKSPIEKIGSIITELNEFNNKIADSKNDIIKKNLVSLSNWIDTQIEHLNERKLTFISLDIKDASDSESDWQEEDIYTGVGSDNDADVSDTNSMRRSSRSAKQAGRDAPVSIKGKEKQNYGSEAEEEQEVGYERSRNSMSLSKINLGVVSPEQFEQSEYPGKTPDSDIPAKIIEESLLFAVAEEKIGPRQIQGWNLKDVEDKGNCFYDAVADQLQLLQHPFLKEVPEGTLPRDSLRLRVQGEKFKDKAWADEEAINTLVKQFHLILAVVDTRSPEGGFTCYHEGEDGKIVVNRGEMPLPEGMDIIRLVHTGNHFLSVLGHPQLERGAMIDSYFSNEKEESVEQKANAWQKEIQENYRRDLEGQEDQEKQINSERQDDDLTSVKSSDTKAVLDEVEDKDEKTRIEAEVKEEEEKMITKTTDSLTFASNIDRNPSDTNKDNTSNETLTNQGA